LAVVVSAKRQLLRIAWDFVTKSAVWFAPYWAPKCPSSLGGPCLLGS